MHYLQMEELFEVDARHSVNGKLINEKECRFENAGWGIKFLPQKLFQLDEIRLN